MLKLERQRWLVIGLAGLALLAHLGIVSYYWGPKDWGQIGMGTIGSLLMAGILWFNRREHRPMHTLVLALLFNLGWLLLDVFHGYQIGRGLSTWVLCDVLFMNMLVYTFLPLNVAHRWNASLCVVLVAAALLAREEDPFLILLAVFVMLFVAFLAEYGREITEAQIENALLSHELHYDLLTGAFSRREMTIRLEQAVQMGQVGVLLLVDIDHFKGVNDRYGHQMGDQALREVTQILKRSVRSDDLVARWGGEEFLILLHGETLPEARQTAARLVEAVRAFTHPSLPAMTISVGGAALAHAKSLDDLLHRADLCLYRAKEEGRDRAVLEGL